MPVPKTVPDFMKKAFPEHAVRVFSPPDGDLTNEKIRAIDVLITPDEDTQTTVFRMYYQLIPEEIERLQQGGYLELSIWNGFLPPSGLETRHPVDVERP